MLGKGAKDVSIPVNYCDRIGKTGVGGTFGN